MPVDITEYQNLAADGLGNRVAAGVEPALAVQQIVASGTSTPSATLRDVTKFIRIHTDVAIRVAFGASPVASATSQRMAANSTEYFGVAQNMTAPSMKIAVITTT